MIIDQLFISRSATAKETYEEAQNSERPARSIAKAISWRLIGTVDTLLVSYWFTGEIAIASGIASIDFVTKMILYFAHERVWNRIKWGK